MDRKTMQAFEDHVAKVESTSKEGIRAQIVELMKDMTRNGFELRLEKRMHRQIELHHQRVEILKSICHKQGLLIEIMVAESKWTENRKVA